MTKPWPHLEDGVSVLEDMAVSTQNIPSRRNSTEGFGFGSGKQSQPSWACLPHCCSGWRTNARNSSRSSLSTYWGSSPPQCWQLTLRRVSSCTGQCIEVRYSPRVSPHESFARIEVTQVGHLESQKSFGRTTTKNVDHNMVTHCFHG